MSEQAKRHDPKDLEIFSLRPPADPRSAEAWKAIPHGAVWTDYRMPHLRDLLFPKGSPPKAPKGAIRNVTKDTPSTNSY